jgi:hypothetical protein
MRAADLAAALDAGKTPAQILAARADHYHDTAEQQDTEAERYGGGSRRRFHLNNAIANRARAEALHEAIAILRAAGVDLERSHAQA